MAGDDTCCWIPLTGEQKKLEEMKKRELAGLSPLQRSHTTEFPAFHYTKGDDIYFLVYSGFGWLCFSNTFVSDKANAFCGSHTTLQTLTRYIDHSRDTAQLKRLIGGYEGMPENAQG